ncbi:PAS domain-containing protein [Thalassococcus sp. BH17M4-6]|uniref:PAS domain-containing protein n=1 Tax=Thalassococcus sp. BH17M4-6 TaxID=3413148 RepID=UPI003BD777E9
MDVFLAFCIGIGATLAALLAQFLLRRSPVRPKADAQAPEQAVILFDGDDIVNASPPAQALLDTLPGVDDWAGLTAALRPRFPDLPDAPPETDLRLRAADTSGSGLRILRDGKATRIILDSPAPSAAEQHEAFLRHRELSLLRTAMATAPHPIWQCDVQGRVLWCNDAYMRLCRDVGHDRPEDPLFDIVLAPTDDPTRIRTSVGSEDRRNRRWYEVCSARSHGSWLNYAGDIDAVVRAEIAQRDFVQTLTKTFAHLPTGLAVFDRDRRLALFNPALIDLSDLSAEFLSRRPNLMSFFDGLRENRMMPEPKNYNCWREDLAALVAAASDDRYCETWSLPSGLTYRITGRPHPDGAIAFLLEDISAEISLTRRFRTELELNQSVLDSIDDAIAVFTPLGVLSYANAPYRALWDSDPDGSLAEVTVIDATRLWQTACRASPIWGDIRDFVLTLRERARWEARLNMADGTPLICCVEPVSGGATVVRFRAPDLPSSPKALPVPDLARA